MRWPDALRWSGLRPTGRGALLAAIAAGLLLAGSIAVALNMVRLSGNPALGAASLVAFLYALHLLLLLVPLLAAAAVAWHRRRAPLAGVLLVGTGAVVVLMSLVPVNAQWRRARADDVRLSVGEYLRPSHGPGRHVGALTVTTADGVPLRMERWAVPEPADGPRPALVLIHGGAWIEGNPGSLQEWNRMLPGLGFEVFDVTYRMPRSVPTGWRPELEVGDVKCAIGWIHANAAELGVDPGRISAMGHSAGGNLALLAGFTTGDADLSPTCDVPDAPLRSVVSIYGPPSLRGMWDRSGTRDLSRDALVEYLGGTPDEVPAAYKVLSPTTHVDGSVPPSFTIIGESDQIVPVEDVRELGRALDAAGAVHEEWYVPGADHLFDASWGSFATQIARTKVTAFLREHG